MTRLYRSESNVIIAGVLGGLAENLKIDATILRVAFVLGTVFSGFFPLVLAYAVAWVVMPRQSEVPGTTHNQRQNGAGAPPMSRTGGTATSTTTSTHEEI